MKQIYASLRRQRYVLTQRLSQGLRSLKCRLPFWFPGKKSPPYTVWKKDELSRVVFFFGKP
jgi:hypothetical protein